MNGCWSQEQFERLTMGLAPSPAQLQHLDACDVCRAEVARRLRSSATNQPSILGRYRLHEELGAGAMGIVFRAFDPVLERDVALKVVRERSAKARARLQREATQLSQVDHANVVRVFDAGAVGEEFYLAMEHLQGRTLQAVADEGDLTSDLLRRVGFDIGNALQALHEANLVHRDVKPDNIFVCREGRVVLMDFSLVRTQRSEQPGGPMSRAGTPAFMAPELRPPNLEPATPRSDQYALAATLRRLAEQAKLRLPWRARRGLRRSLEQQPERRWPSARAFAQQFEVSKTLRITWIAGMTTLLATGMSYGVVDARLDADPCHRLTQSLDLHAATLGDRGESARPALEAARTMLGDLRKACLHEATLTPAQLDCFESSTRRVERLASAEPFDTEQAQRRIDSVLRESCSGRVRTETPSFHERALMSALNALAEDRDGLPADVQRTTLDALMARIVPTSSLQLRALAAVIHAETLKAASDDAAKEAFEYAATLAAELGDERMLAKIWLGASTNSLQRGQLDVATTQLHAALVVIHKLGDPPDLATTLAAARGQLAFLRGDFRTSIAAFEAAIPLALAPARKADLYLNLGIAQYSTGAFEDARSSLKASLELLPTPSDSQLRTLTILAAVLERLGDIDLAHRRYAEALRLADTLYGSEPNLTHATVLNNAASFAGRHERIEESLTWVSRAADIAEHALGRGPVVSRYRANVGHALSQQRRARQGEHQFRRALAALELGEAQSAYAEANARHGLSWTLAQQGKLSEALSEASRAVEVSDALRGEHRSIARDAQIQLALVHAWMDDLAACRRMAALRQSADFPVEAKHRRRAQAIAATCAPTARERRRLAEQLTTDDARRESDEAYWRARWLLGTPLSTVCERVSNKRLCEELRLHERAETR